MAITQNFDLDLFTKPMYKKLLVPAVFSAFGLAFADMIDAIVVGTKMQAEGLAAIGLILPVYMFNAVFANGFGIGGSIKYASLLSKGLKIEAREHFYSTLATAIIFAVLTGGLGLIFIDPLLNILGTSISDGILFTYTKTYLEILLIATPLYYTFYILNYYLRNDSNEKIASIGSIAGNVTDIILSITFVVILNLGTRGAAYSTFIGYLIATVIYWYGIRNKSEILTITGAAKKTHGIYYKLHKDFVSLGFNSLKGGISTSISYLYQLVFFLFCNNILINMTGELGVAVFDLIQNCSYLIYYLYEANAKSMQPLISTYVGENNKKGRQNVIKYGAISAGLMGFVLILFIELYPEIICSLFGLYNSYEAYLALRIFSIGAFFGGINILICNYYQSCECEKPVFLIETLRGIILLLPSAYLLSKFGIDYFWYLYPITEILTLIIFLISNKIKRYEIKTEPDERVYKSTIFAHAESLVEISKEMGEFCEKWNAPSKVSYLITMTVEEVGMAILEYGINNTKNGYIQFTLIARRNGEFRLFVRDNADTYNPFSLNLYNGKKFEMNLDALGMEVVKKSASYFSYRKFNGYNTLVIYL